MEAEAKKVVFNVKPHTAKVYLNSYMRVRVLMEMKDKRKPLHKKPLADILAALDTVPNPNTRNAYLNVVKKIFMSEKHKEVLDAKDKEIRELRQLHKKEKFGLLNKSELPSYTELSNLVKNEKNPKKYFINFLFLKVNVRNQDVAYIKLHKSVEDESELDKDLNHIYIKNGKAVYIRNKYKTANTHGQKRNLISVKKFVGVVNELLGDDESKLLFSKATGEPITNGSISSYFRPFLYMLGNGKDGLLAEGEIMKIVMKHINEEGTFSDLRRVSSNRGTAEATLLNEYDTTNIKQPTENITPGDQIKAPE